MSDDRLYARAVRFIEDGTPREPNSLCHEEVISLTHIPDTLEFDDGAMLTIVSVRLPSGGVEVARAANALIDGYSARRP